MCSKGICPSDWPCLLWGLLSDFFERGGDLCPPRAKRSLLWGFRFVELQRLRAKAPIHRSRGERPMLPYFTGGSFTLQCPGAFHGKYRL